jgi:hypothetical protein
MNTFKSFLIDYQNFAKTFQVSIALDTNCVFIMCITYGTYRDPSVRKRC